MQSIYDAFEPVEAPHTPAPAPPKYGFGLSAMEEGYSFGRAAPDYGWNQSSHESDIVAAFRSGLRERRIETPEFDYVSARMGARLNAAQVEALPFGLRRAARAEQQFWQLVARERQRDPKFMDDYADVADQASLEAGATERRKREMGESDAAYSQSSTGGKVAWWLGNVATAATDPLTYLPIGGGVAKGSSIGVQIAKTATRDVAINAGVTLATEPFVREDAARLGRERGARETAIDVGISGFAGGVLGGGSAALHLLPGHKALTAVIDREDEVRAASPFHATPEGDAEHGSRLAIAMAALEADRPVPAFGSARARLRGTTSLTPPADQFKAAIRAAESSGDDAARNARSSASGRYQFTRATFNSYYERVYGGKPPPAARNDPAVQERLVDALIADNRAALAAAGAPETAGNLYLMHFLGPRGIGVLEAAADTPVARILPAEFIAANPEVLRGKTAGEVAAWADRKMGGAGTVSEAGEGSILRADTFEAEGEYREAMAALDVVDAEAQRLADGQDFSLEAPVVNAPQRRSIIRRGPQDVRTFLADLGGIRDTEGHDLRRGRNLQRFVPGAGPWIRKTGKTIDEAGELLWEAGYFGPPETAPRPTESDVLQMIERAADERVWKPEEAADEMLRRADDAYLAEEQDVRDELASLAGERGLDLDAETLDDAVARKVSGEAWDDSLDRALHAAAFRDVDRLDIATDDRFYATDDSGAAWYGDEAWHGPDETNAIDPAPLAGSRGSEGEPGAARLSGAVGEEPYGPRRFEPEELDAPARFDDPHGPDAVAQLDSIIHDLEADLLDPAIAARRRQEAELGAKAPLRKPVEQDGTIGLGLFDAADQPQFRLSEEGGEVSFEEMFAALEIEQAAIETARACL